MSPTPLRRAAAAVALSALLLTSGAVAAQAEVAPSPTASPTVEPTDEPTATPTVEPTAEPTDEPTATPTGEPTAEPTVEPTAEPTAEPTDEPTPTPTDEPEATLPVPAVSVAQPRCEGTTVVPNGTITVSAHEDVDWIIVRDGTDPLTSDEEDALVYEPEDLGVPASVEVAPGAYEVWAAPWGAEFGDLGAWQERDYFIALDVTVTAFAGPCPAVAPSWTPSADQLTDAKRGGFTTAPRVTAGGQLVLQLDRALAGQTVRAFLFSTPTDLGTLTVAADGTVRVTVPASTTAGTHRVAVYAADGTLIGWQYVEVLAASGLAATGADPRAAGLAVAVLVAAGGALLVTRRRLAAV
ncbi:PT domain-containing protein [Cellulomonas sp. 179-A 9B4 NHS]|uniref:PT domain-containing protein n=1 Tax=Cellulomonas sp. 179-A 9B4 NHS TaxID=3142379 RepID=UPI0039A3134D